MLPLSRSPANDGRGAARVSQPARLGLRAPEVAAGAGALSCRPVGQRRAAGAGALVMFPCGPGGPGGDRVAGAGTEEPAPLGEQATAVGPLPAPLWPPLTPRADAAPPLSPSGSPGCPGSPPPSPAARAGEPWPAGAPKSSAAAAHGEPPQPSPPRRRAGPDCGAGGRGRRGLGGSLGGPGARLLGWLRERSLGRGLFVDPARDNFRTMTNLYGSIHPADSVYLSTRTHGAVFNLEYSPDG